MATRYVYHYCAMSFPDGDTKYITGIATYDDPILDYDAYMNLTANIAGTHCIGSEHITITSLSLLGTKEE